MNGNKLPIIVAIVSLVGLSLAAIVALSFSPDQGTTIALILAFIGPTIAALVALLRADDAQRVGHQNQNALVQLDEHVEEVAQAVKNSEPEQWNGEDRRGKDGDRS